MSEPRKPRPGCFYCHDLVNDRVPDFAARGHPWNPHVPYGPDCADHMAEWLEPEPSTANEMQQLNPELADDGLKVFERLRLAVYASLDRDVWRTGDEVADLVYMEIAYNSISEVRRTLHRMVRKRLIRCRQSGPDRIPETGGAPPLEFALPARKRREV